jgi:hypothetical protein
LHASGKAREDGDEGITSDSLAYDYKEAEKEEEIYCLAHDIKGAEKRRGLRYREVQAVKTINCSRPEGMTLNYLQLWLNPGFLLGHNECC